eukprot:820704-Amphidinium_carterae.1
MTGGCSPHKLEKAAANTQRLAACCAYHTGNWLLHQFVDTRYILRHTNDTPVETDAQGRRGNQVGQRATDRQNSYVKSSDQ